MRDYIKVRNSWKRRRKGVRAVAVATPAPAPLPVPRVVPGRGQFSKGYRLTVEAEELFLRMFAQVAPHEEKHFRPIYELALDLFPHVFGHLPCDVPRFEELRRIVADGGTLPLFEPNTKMSHGSAANT